jgi:hypothetical protein
MNMAESNHTPAVLGIPTWTQNPHQSSNNTLTGFSLQVPTRENFRLDRPVLKGMTPSDRNAAVRRLARMLMEAAGADPKEIGDDEC